MVSDMRWKVVGTVVLIFAGAQFVQPLSVWQTKSEPLLAGADAPDAVLHVLDRSCRDCHSSNTKWPWYSRISPFSWMIADDVERGRQFLNFSNWSSYSRARKLAFVAAMASTANEQRMPPPSYLTLHPEARLSDLDRQVVKSWSRSEFRRLRNRRSSSLRVPKNGSANGS